MKSKKQLDSFIDFCREYPELRFWQALRAWSEADYIFWKGVDLKDGSEKIEDTFYWEKRKV